jgi:hypothetical protein
MPQYSVTGQQGTVSASYKTAIGISAATANASGVLIRRAKVYDINMSAAGAPSSTDTNIQFDLSRQTAAGSQASSSAFALPADPADAAYNGNASQGYTTEPTVTSNSSVFNIAMNQRAPFRWQTYIGSGGELVYPATASNGFVLRVLSAGYTNAAGGTICFIE